MGIIHAQRQVANRGEIICFDISCSLFHDLRRGYLNTPVQARAAFAGQTCRFKAATAFSYRTKRFRDFTAASDLLRHLLAATEIVTFNGQTYDLIALEKLFGEDAVLPLWRLPHHDLKGWKGQSLADSINAALPDLKAAFDIGEDQRRQELGLKYETYRELAGTHRDTKFTCRLFDEYVRSRETRFTFQGARLIDDRTLDTH